MSPALNQRSPVAKAGWLIGVFIVGWLAFLFAPWPGHKSPEPMPRMEVHPPTKLEQVGLRNYTDWESLPEFFAIWADQAEWKDDKTRFAYWHPVMKTYSYYFEATRVEGGYRFREIPEPRDPDHVWDESLGTECPIRFFVSEPVLSTRAPSREHPRDEGGNSMRPAVGKLPIELSGKSIRPEGPVVTPQPAKP